MADIPLKTALARSGKFAHWPKRRTVNRVEPECWPELAPGFQLNKDEAIFTIGSCFARNIEFSLDQGGFDIPVARFLREHQLSFEASPTLMLNRYTPPSIWQELEWTWATQEKGGVVSFEDIEPFLLTLQNGKYIDLRTSYQRPHGVTREEALEWRQMLYDISKEAFACKTVVVTLGLIECWWDSLHEQYVEFYPAMAGHSEKERFVFRRLRYDEAYKYVPRLDKPAEQEFREEHTDHDFACPAVPHLHGRRCVIVANTFSKSMLRTVAGQIAEDIPRVDYFPSFETVTLSNRPEVWMDDLVHVEQNFVSRIMFRVQEAYAGGADGSQISSLADGLHRFSDLVKHKQWPEASALHAKIEQIAAEGGGFQPPFEYLISAADMLTSTGDPTNARRNMEQVPFEELTQTSSPLMALHCASIWDRLGDRGEADALRRRALDRLQGGATELKMVISSLVHDNRVDDAILVMNLSEEAFPADLELMAHVAFVHEQHARVEDAERVYKTAVGHHPTSDHLLAALGQILVRRNKPDEAREAFEAAVANGSTSALVFRKLAEDYLSHDRLPEALAAARSLVAATPGSAVAHALLARALFASREFEAAQIAVTKAVELSGDDRHLKLANRIADALKRPLPAA